MRRPQLMRVAAVLTLAAGLGACGAKKDPRLEKLTAGIERDSVLKIMDAERPEKFSTFLADGQYIEAMYFPLPGATDSASVTERKMSPVILSDGKLVAWGWEQWDSMAPTKKIPVAPK